MAKNTSYDPYKAVSEIYKYKGNWTNATDDTGRRDAANAAAKWYLDLENNGYKDVADQLRTSNYNQAKQINDKWAKMSKEELRPYLYNSKLTGEYGLSNTDIDNLLKFDEKTGQVSFGGKNMGTPYSIVDGASYWNSADIDNAIDSYISRSGITASNDKLISKGNTGVSNKINELWGIQTSDHGNLVNQYNQELDYLRNTNPFETEVGKSILAKYDLSALQGRDNAVASGGASNGGNIDSYAAANALRQQASLISQGQEAALSAHQQRLDNARSLLESLGVSQQNNYASMQNTIGMEQDEAQRLFENEETAKNNEAARQEVYSGITGTVSDTVTKLMNGNIWDENGALKNYGTNFQEQINSLETALNSTTDANERARIKEQLRVLEAARNQKIDEQGLTYGKTYEHQGAPETYTSKKDKADRESAERIVNAEIEAEDKNAKLSAETTKYVADKEAEIATNAKQGNTYTDPVTGAITNDNGTFIDGVRVGDNNGKPILSAEEAEEQAMAGSTAPAVIYALNYHNTAETVNKSIGEAELKQTLTAENLGFNANGKQMKFVNEKLIPQIIELQQASNSDSEAYRNALRDFILENEDAYDLEWDEIKKIYTTMKAPYEMYDWLNNYITDGKIFSWGDYGVAPKTTK